MRRALALTVLALGRVRAHLLLALCAGASFDAFVVAGAGRIGVAPAGPGGYAPARTLTAPPLDALWVLTVWGLAFVATGLLWPGARPDDRRPARPAEDPAEAWASSLPLRAATLFVARAAGVLAVACAACSARHGVALAGWALSGRWADGFLLAVGGPLLLWDLLRVAAIASVALALGGAGRAAWGVLPLLVLAGNELARGWPTFSVFAVGQAPAPFALAAVGVAGCGLFPLARALAPRAAAFLWLRARSCWQAEPGRTLAEACALLAWAAFASVFLLGAVRVRPQAPRYPAGEVAVRTGRCVFRLPANLRARGRRLWSVADAVVEATAGALGVSPGEAPRLEFELAAGPGTLGAVSLQASPAVQRYAVARRAAEA
ncbi:MAG: hypothetical protein D6731_09700, partial [Planctomycetota bacterium]